MQRQSQRQRQRQLIGEGRRGKFGQALTIRALKATPALAALGCFAAFCSAARYEGASTPRTGRGRELCTLISMLSQPVSTNCGFLDEPLEGPTIACYLPRLLGLLSGLVGGAAPVLPQ